MAYPNIFICGQSGSGKSTSLRNLDPASTVIISTERKALPFRNAKAFTKQMQVSSWPEFDRVVEKAYASKNEVIVIESFTSLSEMVLTYCQGQYKGFEIYNAYQKMIHAMLHRSKDVQDKFIVFTGVDEVLQDADGMVTRSVKVEGRSLKGSIEKEFTIVLWSLVIMEGTEKRYVFQTNNDGRTTAKSPMEMFPQYIDNDINLALETIRSYYL